MWLTAEQASLLGGLQVSVTFFVRMYTFDKKVYLLSKYQNQHLWAWANSLVVHLALAVKEVLVLGNVSLSPIKLVYLFCKDKDHKEDLTWLVAWVVSTSSARASKLPGSGGAADLHNP